MQQRAAQQAQARLLKQPDLITLTLTLTLPLPLTPTPTPTLTLTR